MSFIGNATWDAKFFSYSTFFEIWKEHGFTRANMYRKKELYYIDLCIRASADFRHDRYKGYMHMTADQFDMVIHRIEEERLEHANPYVNSGRVLHDIHVFGPRYTEVLARAQLHPKYMLSTTWVIDGKMAFHTADDWIKVCPGLVDELGADPVERGRGYFTACRRIGIVKGPQAHKTVRHLEEVVSPELLVATERVRAAKS